MTKNDIMDQLKDKMLHCQYENERLEMEVESKFEDVNKLEKQCALSKEREYDNEKKLDDNEKRMQREA